MEKAETLLRNSATLLQELLVDKRQHARPGRTLGLPASEIRTCAGLAFIFAFKAGAIVSWTHGSGIVIKKLSEQAGARTRWSAPLFFTLNAAGAGATLGVSEIASVLVLDTPQACDAFLRTQVTLDAELGVSAGHHGGQVDVTAANVTCPRESFHSFTYSRVSRGLMVDVSWNGVGLRVDSDSNALLYGAGVVPAAILRGEVAQPANLMAPLLKVLVGVLARMSPAAGSKPEAGVALATAPAAAPPKLDTSAGAAPLKSCLRPGLRASAAPVGPATPRATVPAMAPAGPAAGGSCASAVRAGAPLAGGAACRAGRRLLAVKEAGPVQPESPPDIVAQLRALSPFAALSHVPIADA